MEQIIYWYVKNDLVTSDTAFFLHVISSGTAITIMSGLSKWDRRRIEKLDVAAPVLLASVAVSPGCDVRVVAIISTILALLALLAATSISSRCTSVASSPDNGVAKKLWNCSTQFAAASPSWRVPTSPERISFAWPVGRSWY